MRPFLRRSGAWDWRLAGTEPVSTGSVPGELIHAPHDGPGPLVPAREAGTDNDRPQEPQLKTTSGGVVAGGVSMGNAGQINPRVKGSRAAT